MDADAPLSAMKFSMRRGTGKVNELCFHLNQKERPSAHGGATLELNKALRASW
jgi:hypothetical protein